jgi:hypothetical protein
MMMMNGAQWYYNNVSPVTGMDSQDDEDYMDHERQQHVQEPVFDEREPVTTEGYRRRERASELFTVPHPDNKNLRVVYRYDGGKSRQGGDSSSIFSPGPVSAGARMSGGAAKEPPSTAPRKKKPQAKAGSPKKQKTEPPSTVLEIENRVLKDVIARQQQQQQQQPANDAPKTPQPAASESNIGRDFQSVPSFSVGVGGGGGPARAATADPESSSNYGSMYDISKNPKESVHVFLHDWFTGTPYDKFDFGAMKRHLARKAEMLADPVIKFVANVAPQCGTSLDRLLVSNAVYEGANNMQELVQKSALNQELLSVLLALVLNEMLGGRGSSSSSSVVVNASSTKEKGADDEGELIPLSPNLVPPKKEPIKIKPEEDTTTVNACMWDEVSRAHAMLKRHADGHPLPCQGEQKHHQADPFDPPATTPDLIGVDGFRSLAQGPPLPGHNPIFADLMSILDYSLRAPNIARWNWNNLPENVGMALVRPEVVAMIEACYEEIRALSPAHSRFTLVHLMTSPRVRQKFALMVGASLNIVPSELQYPNAAPVRGNGSVTDRRITMGAMKEFRETLVYQNSKRWFEHVAYAEASAWKDANNTVNELQKNLQSMRERMWVLIKELKAVLGVGNRNVAKDNLAQSLGLLDRGTEYYKAVLTAYKTLRVFQQAKTRRDDAVAKLTALSINDVAYGAKKASLESEIQTAIAELEYAKVHLGVVRGVISEQAMDQGRVNVWKKHFGSRLSVVVVPFLTHPSLDTDYNGVDVHVPANVGLLDTPQIDMTKVESAVAALVDALKQDMANVNGWSDNRNVASLLYDAHAVASQCLQAIRSYGSASVRYTNALTDVYSMTDEEKRELVYIPPSAVEIPPVRDFLYSSRSSMGANIFI